MLSRQFQLREHEHEWPLIPSRCRSHVPFVPASGVSAAVPSGSQGGGSSYAPSRTTSPQPPGAGPSSASSQDGRSGGYQTGPEKGTGGSTGIGSGSGRLDASGNIFFDCLVCGRAVRIVSTLVGNLRLTHFRSSQQDMRRIYHHVSVSAARHGAEQLDLQLRKLDLEPVIDLALHPTSLVKMATRTRTAHQGRRQRVGLSSSHMPCCARAHHRNSQRQRQTHPISFQTPSAWQESKVCLRHIYTHSPPLITAFQTGSASHSRRFISYV